MRMRKSKQGQAMVEYIIIVVLIAIALFGDAIAKKVSGATSAIDEEKGSEAQDTYQEMEGGEGLRRLDESGNM